MSSYEGISHLGAWLDTVEIKFLARSIEETAGGVEQILASFGRPYSAGGLALGYSFVPCWNRAWSGPSQLGRPCTLPSILSVVNT